MKTIKKLFRSNRTEKDVRLIRRIYALVTLPIFLVQMTSFNLLLFAPMRVMADEAAFSTETVLAPVVTAQEEKKADIKEEVTVPESKPELSQEKIETLTPEAVEISAAVEAEPVAEASSVEVVTSTDENMIPTEPSIDSEAASIEVPVEASSIADPIEAPKEIWSTDGKKSTTNDMVELGKTYVAPQNDQVTVTFTKLPENPGTLAIEEITLSDEQVLSLGALSNKAYDITSNMKDGSFAYDLTLPILESARGKAIEIKFAEDITGLKDASVVPGSDIEVKADKVSATLEHFTVFVASTPATVGASWISLAPITITESNVNDIQNINGTHDRFTLNAPLGSEFNPAQIPSISFTPGGDITEARVISVSQYSISMFIYTRAYSFSIDSLIIGATTPIQIRANGQGGSTNGQIYRSDILYGYNALEMVGVVPDQGLLGNASTGMNVNTTTFGTLTLVAPQFITFGALTGKTYGDADFNVSATASSGLPVTFIASGNCSVSGTLVHVTGAGSCTITATQAGNINFSPASSLSRSFDIAPATLTVTANDQIKEYASADPAFTFTYAGFVNGETSTVIDTAPTCTVPAEHVIPGTYAIVCSGGADNNYTFNYVEGSLKIVDTTAPLAFLDISPITPNGDNNWYVSKPVVTLSATDNYQVDRIEYQLNGTDGAWITYSAPFTLEDGQWQVYYRSIDTSSNVSDINLKNVKVDTTDPENVNNLDATFKQSPDRIQLTWDVNDADIDSVYIYKGSSKNFVVNASSRIAKNNSNDTNYSDYDVTAGEKYYYKFVTVDNAGNKSNVNSISIALPVEGSNAVVTNEGAEPLPSGTILGVESAATPEQVASGQETPQGAVQGAQASKDGIATSNEATTPNPFLKWILAVIALGVVGGLGFRYVAGKRVA